MFTGRFKTVHSWQQWLINHWDDKQITDQPSTVSFLFRVAGGIFLYMLLDRWLLAVTRIPVDSYFEPVILLTFLKYVFTSWDLLLFLPFIGLLIYYRKQAFRSWSSIPNSHSIKIIVLICAAMLAWYFAFYDYNFFFDRAHFVDRGLLLLLLILVYFRPVFLLPFLLILFLIIWQFASWSSNPWTPFSPAIKILILFYVFFLLFLFTGKLPLKDFVFLSGCLLAAQYFASGAGKFNWIWIRDDQISTLLHVYYSIGWLSFLEPSAIEKLTQLIDKFNVPLKIFTLLFEFGAILFFVNKTTMRFFLIGWIILHLGILLIDGLFFWVWMSIEAVFLWLSYKRDFFKPVNSFGKIHILASVVIIGGGIFWCSPPRLNWYDLPMNYDYQLEAETQSGATILLPPDFFSPYVHQFTFGSLNYLMSRSTLNIIRFTTRDDHIAKNLMEMTSEDEFYDFESTYGRNQYREGKASKFYNFIEVFIQNFNKRSSGNLWINYFEAPRFILTYPKWPSDQAVIIESVKIKQITTFFNNGVYKEIRTIDLKEISIP